MPLKWLKELFPKLALILSVALVLSPACPVFAQEPTTNPRQLPDGFLLAGSIDQRGVVSEALEITFEYTAAKIKIDIQRGTLMLAADGIPLERVELVPVGDLLVAPVNYYMVGQAFDLSPDGAYFSLPLSITVEYSPTSCPSGVDEKNLFLAYFDVQTNHWVELESEADPATHTVTAQLSHFTLIAVLGEPVQGIVMRWSLVWWIMTAVIVLGLAASIFIARKRVFTSA